MLEDLSKFSFKYFGKYSDRLSPHFEDLKDKLAKADIELSVAEYVSVIILISIFSFLGTFGFFFMILILTFVPFLESILLSSLASVFGGIGAFIFAYFYPSFQISARKKSINIVLPYATTYMATIAGSGIEYSEVFRILSEFKEYGELTREAEKIVRDIDIFGLDLKTALKRAADRSPSPKFRELLWGVLTTITVGGSLNAFLQEEAESFMRDFRRDLDKYSAEVSLFTEIYLTIIVVGTVFLVVLTSVMGAIAGAGFIRLINMFAVYVFVPAASIFFTIIARVIHPGLA